MKAQTRNNIIGVTILAIGISIGVSGFYGAFTNTFGIVKPYIIFGGVAMLLIFWISVALWGRPNSEIEN